MCSGKKIPEKDRKKRIIRIIKGKTAKCKGFEITREPQEVFKLHDDDEICSLECHSAEIYTLKIGFDDLRDIQEAYDNHLEKYKTLHTDGHSQLVLKTMRSLMNLT